MSEFERIGLEPARQLLEQGAAVVDIRDPHSFAGGHITGALHLDNTSLPDFVSAADREQTPDIQRPLQFLPICRCQRRANQLLCDRGNH